MGRDSTCLDRRHLCRRLARLARPTGCGTTGEKGLHLKWDGKTGEGVLWKTTLETSGHSSPIVWGDRVFMTSSARQTQEQEQKKEIPDHFFDRYRASDGKLLWHTRVAYGPMPAYMGAYCAPTPVTDGKTVYGLFASGVAAAVDFDGTLLWCRELSGEIVKKPDFNPTICSSKVLSDDKLIVLLEQNHSGTLQAWDKRSGELKWEHKRDGGCGPCNTTPLLIDVRGKPQLVVLAHKALQSFGPADGRLLWWCTAAHGFASSPLYSSGLIYADLGEDRWALAIDPTGKRDVTETHVKWKVKHADGLWSSAVADGRYVYRVGDSGMLTCRELATGKTVYKERLENVSKLASPIATADGRIYFVTTGQSFVIKAGPKFEILGGGHAGGWDMGSSLAVANGRIFVRDNDGLYCLGKK